MDSARSSLNPNVPSGTLTPSNAGALESRPGLLSIPNFPSRIGLVFGVAMKTSSLYRVLCVRKEISPPRRLGDGGEALEPWALSCPSAIRDYNILSRLPMIKYIQKCYTIPRPGMPRLQVLSITDAPPRRVLTPPPRTQTQAQWSYVC